MHQYKYLWVPITALILAQLIKFIIESFHCKQLKWGRLFNGSGGMPSSHTTFTVSLTTMVGFYETLTSPMFAICLVFTCIVMYDAIGLRLESGKQASMINQIVDEIFSKNRKQGVVHLKEQLGHNPKEVLFGILLGITYTLGWCFILNLMI